MKSKVRIPMKTRFDAQILKQSGFNPRIPIGTKWEWSHFRKNANGIYEPIDEWMEGNVCTAQGLNHMLDSTFHGSTRITAWYILLFSTNTTPADGTTYAVPVFTEVNAKYDEATRPAYTEAAASGKSITNSASKATFTFNDSETIYGAALVGGGGAANTKGDTAGGGTMFCASKFSSSKAVVSTDILQVSCTITLADV